MPSMLIDDSKRVSCVMSFDSVEEGAIFLDKYDATLIGKYYVDGAFLDNIPDLSIQKAEKILAIKAEAERRIHLLDWRLERAKEREVLGIAGYETVNNIHQLKEDIRQWSNQLEVELMQLDTLGDVSSFVIE